MAKFGAIVGLAAVASALLPSPTTIAKFKPWRDADPAVRRTFWASIVIGGLLVLAVARKG